MSLPYPETGTTPEILPPITLKLPICFAGKIYTGTGATEHLSDPLIKKIYDANIARSPQSQIPLKAGDFSTPRPKTYGFFRSPTGPLMQANIIWRTEGDYAVDQGLEPSIARIFPSTEVRIIDNKPQLINLLAQGYNVFNPFTTTENLIWTMGEHKRQPLSLNGRTFNHSQELLTITGDEPGLWDSPSRLQNDSLVAGIADAYLQITAGKLVRLVKPEPNNPQLSVLIAQALCQMTATRLGKLVHWATEDEIFNNCHLHLSFLNQARAVYQKEIIINPNQSVITDKNRATVDQIRDAFSLPLPQALKIWKRLE